VKEEKHSVTTPTLNAICSEWGVFQHKMTKTRGIFLIGRGVKKQTTHLPAVLKSLHFKRERTGQKTSRFRHFVLKKCNTLAQRNTNTLAHRDTKQRNTNTLAHRDTKHRNTKQRNTNTLAHRDTKHRSTSPFYQLRRSAIIEFKKIGRKVFIISLTARQFKLVAV